PLRILAVGERLWSIFGSIKPAGRISRYRSSNNMNADEKAVQDFLKGYPGIFVTVTEISHRLDGRRKFRKDRAWARPLLRRMEMDGLLESNECGEYRLNTKTSEATSFKAALAKPDVALGDTTLICLDEEPQEES